MPKLLMLLVLATGCGVAHANEPADAGTDAYIHLYGGDAGGFFGNRDGGFPIEVRNEPRPFIDPFSPVHFYIANKDVAVFDWRTKRVTITPHGARDGYTCVVGH